MTKDRKGSKIGLLIAISVVFIVISLLMIIISGTVKTNKNKVILSYSEVSDVNYKVYYNEEGENKVIDEGNEYTSSLIDNIVVEYNYNFLSDKKIKSDYGYKIDAIIEISDNNKVIDSKNYSLISDVKKNVEKTTGFKVSEVLDIKYNTYINDIQENYNPNYSYVLKVVMSTNYDAYINNKNINNSGETILSIPLMKDSFKIEKNTVSNYDEIKGNVEVLVKNKPMIMCGFFLAGIGIIILIASLIAYSINPDMAISYKTEYKKIRKMVREYDELIKRTYKMPPLKDKTVKEVETCDELIAVRDKYDLPMTMVEKETTVVFVVMNNSKAWTYTIEKIDQ